MIHQKLTHALSYFAERPGLALYSGQFPPTCLLKHSSMVTVVVAYLSPMLEPLAG